MCVCVCVCVCVGGLYLLNPTTRRYIPTLKKINLPYLEPYLLNYTVPGKVLLHNDFQITG